MAKPKITKIKAKDEKTEKNSKKAIEAEAVKQAKEPKGVKKAEKAKKTEKRTFFLFRPFVALFRYLRDAWKEIRQVRWPSRKDTWKMVLAVAIYTALFVVVISLLDLLFTWLFNLILGN